MKSRAWWKHWEWIAPQFLTAPRMLGKLRREQPLMKSWCEQSGHFVNSLYLSANKVIPIYPSQHTTMYWSNFTRWSVLFENRKCWSLWRPIWMNCWQENPISEKIKGFIQSLLQWRFSCTGLKRLLYQNEGNFTCAWIEPDKQQPYCQMLIGRGQLSNWRVKSIRWHLSKLKLFDKSFQHHEQQLLHQVRTKATCPQSTYTETIAQMETAAGYEADRAVIMTTEKRVQFLDCLSDSDPEAATWSITDKDRLVNQLERELDGMTLKDQMRFMKESSIRLVEFGAWWHAIGVQEPWQTIKQQWTYFAYPMMHLVSWRSESIRLMGSGDNLITDISDWLHTGNLKQTYRSTNTLNYIEQMLKHNHWCTSLDYMEETLSYLTLQGWYDIDSGKVFNLLWAANKLRNVHRAHLVRIQHCPEEPFFRP